MFGFRKKNVNIESVEIITLRLSGMRFTNEYEILTKDGFAEVTRYDIRYSEGKDCRVIDKQEVISIDEMLKLLNDCRVLSWDGFDGPHPKRVRDGIMFKLEGIVNGDKKIYARGSQNFPKRFSEFRDGLYRILNNQPVKRTETGSWTY